MKIVNNKLVIILAYTNFDLDNFRLLQALARR